MHTLLLPVFLLLVDLPKTTKILIKGGEGCKRTFSDITHSAEAYLTTTKYIMIPEPSKITTLLNMTNWHIPVDFGKVSSQHKEATQEEERQIT